MHFIAENLAPIMFAAMIVLLLTGLPVGFTLGFTGLLFFVIGVELAPYAPDVIGLDWALLQALPSRVFGVMSNDVLLAIPFFTFMGLVLERSGMAEDLLETVGQLFGTVRGGLAYAVVLVGALLAATTGVLSAAVLAMGLISLPIMLRYGYDRKISSGVIAASGTLSLIMPPSIVLIVLADQLGRSVGDMYQGAFLPALVLTGCYLAWIFVVSLFRPKALPGLPREAIKFREPSGGRGLWQIGAIVLYSGVAGYVIVGMAGIAAIADKVVISIFALATVAFLAALLNRFRPVTDGVAGPLFLVVGIALILFFQGQVSTVAGALAMILGAAAVYVGVARLVRVGSGIEMFSQLCERFTFVMVPPLLLIFLVLGTIFIGVATPTEAGAMGALGAVCIAAAMRFANRNPDRLSWKILKDATFSTAELSAFVMILLIGARVFSLTFYGINGHIWIEHLLGNLPAGELGFMIFAATLVFVLGFFLDFFEIAFIVLPLLVPTANALGIDLVWLGVVIAVTLQTAFMHPPFGFALIYLRSVAPRVAYVDPVSGHSIAPVTSGQIYLGAIPFLAIQCIVIGIVIVFPSLVMHYKGKPAVEAPASEFENILNNNPSMNSFGDGDLLINKP